MNILELYVAFSLGVAFAVAAAQLRGTERWVVALLFLVTFIAWPVVLLRGWR